MSAKITGMIFESTLPPSQRLVLLALADRGSSDGRNIYPSILEVTGMTGLSGRHVKRVLLDMKKTAIILVEEQAGYHSPNRYRINLSKLDKQARVTPLRELPALTPDQESRRADAELIYAEYPRKTERQYAIRAIIKALKGNTKEFLIERTKLYASMVNGSDKTFVPYAQKWFNRERFKDDPSTWKNGHDAESNNASVRARKKAAEEELAKTRSTNYPSPAQVERIRALKTVIAECNREITGVK